MNEIIVQDNIKIEDLIYEVRGKQVMLAHDLATLYGVTSGNLNKARNRNIERFPEDFCFRLTKKEYETLIFQSGISKLDGRTINRGLPFVYTEEGIAMLSSVLKTKAASIVSVSIMRAFVAMKKYVNTNLIEQKYINNLVLEHDYNIKMLQESFDKLSAKEKISHIFFDGQIYDAYSLLIEILSKAKKEIIIIDNYAGKELFDITKNIKINIKVYTKNIDNVAKAKYENQYNNLTIINTDIFHDRFIIIDTKILYHCGSSFKDLGKKCFAITKIDDDIFIKELIDKLDKINIMQ